MLVAFLFSLCAFEHPSALWRFIGGPNDALPEAQILSIQQDSYGFMWFGTGRGIIRYDGFEARWYRHDPDNPNSLTPGTVRVVMEDSQRRLWVGTNGGLNLLDRVTGLVTSFTIQTHSLRSNNIWSLLEDQHSRIWLGSDQGLQVMDDQSFTTIADIHVGVTSLVQDQDDLIWIAAEDRGLFFYDGEHVRSEEAFKDIQVRTLYCDQEGLLWLGTTDRGLWVRGKHGNFEQVNLHGNPAHNSHVTSIHKDANDSLWVGTVDGLYQQNSVGFTLHRPTEQNNGLNDLRIRRVFCDDSGLVWVATEKPGVHVLDRMRERFEFSPVNSGGAWSLWQGQENELWIGTKKGLQLLQLDNLNRQTFMSDQSIRSIYPIDEQNLLVGTDAGLFRLNHQANQVQTLLDGERVWVIVEFEGQFWLATDRGLILFDIDKSVVMRLTPEAEAPYQISHRVVTSICRGNDRDIWVGTFGGGLIHVHSDGTIIEVMRNQTQRESLSADDVIDVFMDHNQTLWVATLSGGLNRMISPNRFERFTSRSGLPDNAVVAITQDNNDGYWIYTAAGIASFDPDARSYSLFRDEHGVMVGSAIPGSVAMFDDHLWFGGTNGVVKIKPSLQGNESIPPIMITDVMVDNIRRQHMLPPGSDLHLPANEKSFSIRFARLDFRSPATIRGAYQRVDIDQDWVQSTDVNYTQYLPFGGVGKLRMRAADTYQRWIDDELVIHVETPWWVSWLPLWIIIGLLLITSLTYVIMARIHRAKQRKLIEQAQLAKQRALLAERQHEVEIKARQIQEEHNQIMQEYLEQLSNEIANELHDGPLGRITGLGFQIHHLGASQDEGEIRKQLQQVAQEDIPQICDGLRNLCGELLSPDLREGLIAEMSQYAETVCAQTPGLTLVTDWQAQIDGLSDEEQGTLFRIFRTLVKNVSKHAQAKTLKLSLTRDPLQFMLRIVDDGCGFEPPETWDDLKAKRHYGMYLAHYFCTSLGGTMQVESILQRGTTINIRIPRKSSVAI